ncbi:MAG: DUF3530 family protein [Oleiphilaceae bacterium]|nr:DUF3530 family protein [Oleiphilaceae bacterium]
MWRRARPGWGLVCLLALLWLTPLPAQEEDPAQPDGEAAQEEPEGPRLVLVTGNRDQALKARFPEQVVMLDSGEGRFAALELRETTASRQGAALIVADTGQSPDATLVQALRQHLPDGGWRTLAMGLPPMGVTSVPERVFAAGGVPAGQEEGAREEDGQEENGQDQDGNKGQAGQEAQEDTAARGLTLEMSGDLPRQGDAMEVFQGQSLARVAAGVVHLRQAGYNNVVLIGVGAGADTVARFVRQNPRQLPEGGLGMVWLAARFQAPLDRDLEALFGTGWDLPVLDLVDSRQPSGDGERRRNDARRGEFANYHQQTMPLSGVDNPASQKRIAHRVRAWLKKHRVGREL